MQTTIQKLARDLELPLAPEASAALATYADLVKAWNARMNLTSARTPTALVEVLFADALVLADTALLPHGLRIVDVGTGAGAPALPLLVLRPDLTATLVEPLRKRVTFLRTAIGSLELAARTRVVEAKLDPRAPRLDGTPFDAALSRATLAPPEWLSLGMRLAPRVLVLTAQEDPPAAPQDTRFSTVEYRLPSTGALRRITAYQTA